MQEIKSAKELKEIYNFCFSETINGQNVVKSGVCAASVYRMRADALECVFYWPRFSVCEYTKRHNKETGAAEWSPFYFLTLPAPGAYLFEVEIFFNGWKRAAAGVFVAPKDSAGLNFTVRDFFAALVDALEKKEAETAKAEPMKAEPMKAEPIGADDAAADDAAADPAGGSIGAGSYLTDSAAETVVNLNGTEYKISFPELGPVQIINTKTGRVLLPRSPVFLQVWNKYQTKN